MPTDDGAYDHLHDFTVPPDLSLPIARNPSESVKLADLEGLSVIFCYPRTGMILPCPTVHLTTQLETPTPKGVWHSR